VRAGSPMSGVSRPEVPAREEPALVAAPGLLAAITAVAVVLTAGVFAAVGDHETLASTQRLDDAWLRLTISGRALPLTVIANVFNLLGLVYVTLPVRIAIAGFLALRRRWWRLAAFVAAIVLSEILLGLLKEIYGRARPPDSLVATSGTSFPSGHAVAASVTAVAAVIALVPAGRWRAWWAMAAVAFSILMGLSRAYLGAHWLSDVVAGILLGTSCALLTALVVDQIQRRQARQRQRQPAVGQYPVDAAAADHIGGRRKPP
jgi:membrane-associated phospholipid phosphatase